jgi:two-component system, cell cycle sensor histidine kinase and response regulator CckA
MERKLIERLLEDLTRLRDSIATESPAGDDELDRSDWLTSILAHSPDVISVLDPEGRLLFVSRAAPGIDARALRGHVASTFLGPEHRAVWDEAVRLAVSSGTTQRVEVLSRNAQWWDTRLVPIQRDGTVSWVMTIGTDITARRQAEATLVLRDELLKLALEASGMGQFSWEVQTDRITWDPAAKRIFDWPLDDDDITFGSFLGRVHTEDRERVRAEITRAVETGEFSEHSYRIQPSDGAVRWVLAKGRALRSADGTTARMTGGVIDITFGKRTDAQLQRSQKLEAVGQLAGGVAHDFNNLLVAILGNITLAQRSGEAGEQSNLLKEATAAAHRAAELTRQLLAFSTRQPVNQGPLDVNLVLEDTLTLLRRLLPESVEIDMIPGHRLPRVNADRGQLEQVFVNLCVNARDAMPNGGKLVLESEAVVINGRFRETHPWARPGRYLLISVSDTGVGIPLDALDHVFEPFYTTKPQGTGLGLATVYGTVQRHGGFVHVYSEVGQGTTFKVYLPVADRDAADVGTKMEEPVVGGTETILVAEDEERVRAVVVRILQRAGYKVITAENGEEAVRRFREAEGQVHLVLADAVMPVKNGADAISEIRTVSPNMVAVLCSGYSDALGSFSTLGPGVTFLAKPYEPDVLLRVVRRQLDWRAEGLKDA